MKKIFLLFIILLLGACFYFFTTHSSKPELLTTPEATVKLNNGDVRFTLNDAKVYDAPSSANLDVNNFVRYQEGKKIVVCDVTLENISIPTGELDISFIQLRSKTDFLNKTYNDIERIDNEISYFSGGDFSNLKRYYMFNLPQSEKNNYQVAFLVDPDSAELNNLALELGVSPDSSQGIALQTT